MSKYVTSSTKHGLGLRLCWRSGAIDSVVLEDAQPKNPAGRHSDGVHIRLSGTQCIEEARWNRLNLDEELDAIQAAKLGGKQSTLDNAMKALAAVAISLSADAKVTLVDSASAWALSQHSAKEYAESVKARKQSPKRLIQDLKSKADEERVAYRVGDWSTLESAILVAMGLRPLKTSKPAKAAGPSKVSDEVAALDEAALDEAASTELDEASPAELDDQDDSSIEHEA